MKKILTVLLIAVMAAGFVFASVSGNVKFDAKYDTKTKVFAFGPSTKVTAALDLGEAVTTANEGDVYATASAAINVLVGNVYTDGKYELDVVVEDATGAIIGQGWKVNFYMAKFSPVDFATSAIDTYHKGVKNIFGNYYDYTTTALTMDSGFAKNQYGTEIDACGAKVGIDFAGNANNDAKVPFAYKLYAITPEVAAAGVTAQAGVATEQTAKDTKVWNLGAKAAYAVDAFSATVASDIKFVKEPTKDVATNFDIAGKIAYDFATADIYYVSAAEQQEYDVDGAKLAAETTWNKYMSAQVAANLAKFEVPVTVTVKATDLLAKNDGREFKFTVAYKGIVDATAYTSFVKDVNVKYGATVTYTADVFKATASAAFKYDVVAKKLASFMPTAEVSSDKLVSGATLSLGWYSNTSSKNGDFEKATSNLLKDSTDNGYVRARVQINF